MISSLQIKKYFQEGFVVLENVLSIEKVQLLSKTLDSITQDCLNNHFSDDEMGIVFEENKKAIRTIYGLNKKQVEFNKLCKSPVILQPVYKLLNNKNLYVHQFKVNLKSAFDGNIWPWHQDFIFWNREDGIPNPKILSVMILLDDVFEYNSPLMFIPKSHSFGILDIEENCNTDNTNFVGTNLKYKISQNTIARLANNFGISIPKPNKGSIIIFNSNIAHASVSNLSHMSRRSILITYNPISNVTSDFVSKRPRYLCNKNLDI